MENIDNLVVYLNDKHSCNLISENMKAIFESLGGLGDIIKPGKRVIIKPNFVAPFSKAATNILMIETVLQEILAYGGVPIVGDSSGFEFHTDSTIRILEINKMLKKYNLAFVNFDDQDFVSVPVHNYHVKEFFIPKVVCESDVIINMPKLKKHVLTNATLGMKNLFGIIHRDTRRKIHAFGLEEGIIILNQIIKPQLTIVDGLWVVDSAVYGSAEYKGIMIAGRNVNLVDYVACRSLGLNYKDVTHIKKVITPNLMENIKLEVIGDDVHPLRSIRRMDARKLIKNKMKNLSYQFMYALDLIYNKITKRSLVPDFHLSFGVKPKVIMHKCNYCRKCVEICPIRCISKDVSIDYNKCKYVRCLKCYEICPHGAIEIKTISKKSINLSIN